jgi:hypothetical protein
LAKPRKLKLSRRERDIRDGKIPFDGERRSLEQSSSEAAAPAEPPPITPRSADEPPPQDLADMPGIEPVPASFRRDHSIHQAISFTTGDVLLPIESLTIEEKMALLHTAGREREDRENAANAGFTTSGGILRRDNIGGRR